MASASFRVFPSQGILLPVSSPGKSPGLGYAAGFPGAKAINQAPIAGPLRVRTKWEMMGVEPTVKKVEVSGVEINHVENGGISASCAVSDALGLVQQLGAL
jgi:hypothetical protein